MSSAWILFVFIIIVVGVTTAQDNNDVRFSCQGRPSGYYADVQSGCQIYHMCDTLGRQFSYSCPNTTLFQQRMLICDHWYMVNCSKSEVDYDANLLIGQREKPFVADDAEHPYHRTPRPDLLAHPSASEYNIVYREGRAQQTNQQNLVGGGDQPYFLPSHWSTDYRQSTTPRSSAIKESKTKKPQFPQKEVAVNEPHVNFKSNFKATTPVYPRIAPTERPLGVINNNQGNQPRVVLEAPLAERRIDEPPVAFPSNFRATTPVYPTFVTPEEPLANVDLPAPPNASYGLSSIVEPPNSPLPSNAQNAHTQQVVVNFKSSYQATTPVYPRRAPTELPLAIQDRLVDPNVPNPSTVIQPPRAYAQNQRNTLLEPSVVFQAPAPFTAAAADTPNEIQVHSETRSPFVADERNRLLLANLDWQALRKVLLIPDVQFPLDASAVRPNYDAAGPNSFQVHPIAYELRQRKHATRRK